MSTPLLLGHRGARATRRVAENTFESFDLALAHGCDGFEFDVRLTADGRCVICHDPTSNGCEVAQARACDLQGLPELDSVLRRYAGKAFLDIELKVAGLEQSALNALSSCAPHRGYVISSFLPEVLQALHALNPEAPLGLICEDMAQVAACRDLPVEYAIPHYTLVDRELCQTLHSHGKRVFVWTVNRRKKMTYFRDIEVDGIISDNTRLLIEVLKN